MRDIKFRAENTMYFVYNYTAHNLVFVDNPVIEKVVFSLLASTQRSVDGVDVCCFTFTPSGYEMILRNDTGDISVFMQLFDRLCTVMFKKLLGVSYQSIWIGRFKEKVLPTYQSVVYKMSSIYLKPLVLGLTDSVQSYGLSSYSYFQRVLTEGDEVEEIGINIESRHLKKISKDITETEEKELLEGFEKKRKRKRGEIKLVIKPLIWKKCFKETKDSTNRCLVNIVKKELKRQKRVNKLKIDKAYKENKDKRNPSLSAIYNTYTPVKWRRDGPYFFCLEKKLTDKIMEFYREYCRECALAYEVWKQTGIVSYPAGAFVPSGPPKESFSLGKPFW
ncbi:MAG: hypothetical protein D6780_06595 [Candidatus Dadabacteria bacterium]|nr:MAG: hypothetical protein D6780_06595 [Candidatus Dadabacteria bacterium]